MGSSRPRNHFPLFQLYGLPLDPAVRGYQIAFGLQYLANK